MAQNGTRRAPRGAELTAGAPQLWKRGVLGFGFAEGQFVAAPDRPFKPRGLIIWGAPAGAQVRMALLDQREQVLRSADGIPARFFASGDSFEEIAKQLDAGKEPPAWVDFDMIDGWAMLRVVISSSEGMGLSDGDGLELVLWGYSQLPGPEPEALHVLEHAPPASSEESGSSGSSGSSTH